MSMIDRFSLQVDFKVSRPWTDIFSLSAFVTVLPYLDMRPYTDDEFNTLPHVIFTSDVDWDPRILDFDVEGVDEWYGAISDNVDHTDLFDIFGDYKGCTPDLDVSSTDMWFETVAPDQYLRTQMEEITFICSEHAVRVQNLDHDNFALMFSSSTILKMLVKLLTTSTQSSHR